MVFVAIIANINAASAREMDWSQEGRIAWQKFYHSIPEFDAGIVGSIVARSDAHVLRLTMVCWFNPASILSIKKDRFSRGIGSFVGQFLECQSDWRQVKIRPFRQVPQNPLLLPFANRLGIRRLFQRNHTNKPHKPAKAEKLIAFDPADRATNGGTGRIR